MEPVSALATIAAALKTIDHGVQLTRSIVSGAKSDTVADHREQLAETREALLDAKNALVDARSALEEQEAEVARLKEAFELKTKVVRFQDAYYDVGNDGAPYGDPYCLRCYQEEQKLRLLTHHAYDDVSKKCSACQQEYRATYTMRQG